jgi:hypothetical protein
VRSEKYTPTNPCHRCGSCHHIGVVGGVEAPSTRLLEEALRRRGGGGTEVLDARGLEAQAASGPSVPPATDDGAWTRPSRPVHAATAWRWWPDSLVAVAA